MSDGEQKEELYHFSDDDLDISQPMSIRVTTDGRPFKLEFYKMQPAYEYDNNSKSKLTNEDRLAPSISPKGVNFFEKGDTWKRMIRNKILSSPECELSEEEVSDIIDRFEFVSSGELKELLDLDDEEEDEEGESEGLSDEVKQEIEERAEEILNSDNAMDELNEELDNMIAGEELNRAFVFLVLLSGKIDEGSKKQIVLIKGEAGGGKSTLMDIADAFKVKDVGRFTKHALDYSDLEGYDVLRLKEIGKMDQEEQGVSTLKFLSSDDEGYKVEYTVRDPETGEFMTEEKHIPPITVISSTTRIDIEGQFERRAWFVSPDESEEQTDRIGDWKGEKEIEEALVKLGKKELTDYEKSKRILKKVVEKINPPDVMVPFPKSLHQILGNRHLRVRGDYDKIRNFVSFYTLFHSYGQDKPTLGDNGTQLILSTPEDGKNAIEYARKPLVTMLSGIEERIREMLKAMGDPDMGLGRSGTKIDVKDRKDIAKEIGKSDKTIKRYFNKLEEEGYVVSKKDGRSKSYELLEDVDTILSKEMDISGQEGIPDKYLERFAKEGIYNIKRILDKAYEGVEPPLPPLDPYTRHLPEEDDVQVKGEGNDGENEGVKEVEVDKEEMSSNVQLDSEKEEEDDELPEGLVFGGEAEDEEKEDREDKEDSESKEVEDLELGLCDLCVEEFGEENANEADGVVRVKGEKLKICEECKEERGFSG